MAVYFLNFYDGIHIYRDIAVPAIWVTGARHAPPLCRTHRTTVLIPQTQHPLLSSKPAADMNMSYSIRDQYMVKRLLWQGYSMEHRQLPSQEVWGEVQKYILNKFGWRRSKDGEEDINCDMKISNKKENACDPGESCIKEKFLYQDDATINNLRNKASIFKIKPGNKKVEKSVKSGQIIQEIKLTFNLSDLGLNQETIKLQDFSLEPKVCRKRKAGPVDFPLVINNGEVSEKKSKDFVKNNQKLYKENGERRKILQRIVDDSNKITEHNKEVNHNNSNLKAPDHGPHLPGSVISACWTACDKISNTIARNIGKDKLKQDKSEKVVSEISESKKYITKKIVEDPNEISLFKIPSTKQYPNKKKGHTKEQISKPSLHISKVFNKAKASSKTSNKSKEEEDDGHIVMLPCSNCSNTTVVYPCSCGNKVYCGTVCQVGLIVV